MKPYKRNLLKLKFKYKHFKCAFIHQSGFWKHLVYPDDTNSEFYTNFETITDREIFGDEIVIETDMPLRQTNRRAIRQLYNKLVPYTWTCWFSGNKSYHIHIIFKELLNYDKYDKELIKELFIRYITRCPLLVPQVISCSNCPYDTCYIMKNKIDLLLCKTHLIRLEYSQHPHTLHTKSLVEDNDTSDMNRLPTKVIKLYNSIKLYREKLPKPKKVDVKNMECIKYLLTNDIQDCRKRVLFILTKKLITMCGAESALSLLLQWNDCVLSRPMSKYMVHSQVRYHMDKKDTMSCRYIRGVLKEAGLIDLCSKCEVNK